MKQYYFCKSIFFSIMLVTIYSCSRTDVYLGDDITKDENHKVVEGCEIKNPETAVYRGVLKTDYIYLYGSRKGKENEPERLWVAQYSLQHELLKEYVETVDGLSLQAIKMLPIHDGKYLITGNSDDSQSADLYNITEQLPAIFDPVKKELKIIRISKGFFFDVVNEYDDFMLLSLSDREIELNPAINSKAYRMVQMNYEGKVLFYDTNMRIPDKESRIFWLNQNEYIAANLAEVCSTFLDGKKDNKWKQGVNVPAQSVLEITTEENNVKVEYKYAEKERNKNRIYLFELETGQQKTAAEQISTCVQNNELVLVGNKELDLQADILPANTYLKHLKYETSDASVATVTENGIVKTLQNGNCIIYISSEDGFAEQEIQLTVSSLSFTQKNHNIMVGQTKLLAIVADENISPDNLVWKSSNESVASVNAKGEVTGLQKGQAIINVTSKDGALEADCAIEVKDFMDFIKATQSLSFIGNNSIGKLWLAASFVNENDNDGEVISCSLCYEEDKQMVILLAENKEFLSKTEVEVSLTDFTVYPSKKPYIKLEVKYKDKVYEAKYSISI